MAYTMHWRGQGPRNHADSNPFPHFFCEHCDWSSSPLVSFDHSQACEPGHLLHYALSNFTLPQYVSHLSSV